MIAIGAVGLYRVSKTGDFAMKKTEVRQMADDFLNLRNNIIEGFSHLDSYCGLSGVQDALNNNYAINNNLLPSKFWVEEQESGGVKIRYGDNKEVVINYVTNGTMLPPGGTGCKGFFVKYTQVDKEVARRLIKELHPFFDSIKWGSTSVKNYGDFDEAAANSQYHAMKSGKESRAGINFTKYGK